MLWFLLRISHGRIAIWQRQNIVAAGPANGLKNRVIRGVYSFGVSAQSGSIDWREQAGPYRPAIAQYVSDFFLPNVEKKSPHRICCHRKIFKIVYVTQQTLSELCAALPVSLTAPT